MPEQRWFIRVRGRVLGPFNREQLRALRERGHFHPFHEISEDRKQWLPASGLAELFAGDGTENIAIEEPSPRGVAAYTPRAEVRLEPAHAAAEWFFVSAAGKQEGPVSAEHLMGLLRQKTVTSATLVWKEGMGNWLALAEAGLGAPTVSAAGDLGNAFKRFLTDPVGGLPELCEALGGRRALLLGICFCLICDFCLMLSGFLWFLMYASNHDPFDNQLFIHFNLLWEMARSHKMAFLLKLLVLAFLPLFSLAGAISCVRAVTSGRGQFGYDLLISGTAILPIGLFCPIAVLLGPLNFEVILFAYVLIFCLMILFLNCGFTRIVGLSDRGAILAVPATLIIMFWLVKVIVTSEFLNTFGG